jgi:hypothetical protein
LHQNTYFIIIRVLNNPNTKQLILFITTHFKYYINLVTQISMISDLEKIAKLVVRIVFHHSIVRVHVVNNI